MEWLFFVVAFLAEIVGTIAGFGSSTILLPVALLFFDFKAALVLVAFMHLFGNLGRVTFFRKGLDWRVLLYFGVIGVVGTLLGALLVMQLDQAILKAGLGVFLIGYGLLAVLKPSFELKQFLLDVQHSLAGTFTNADSIIDEDADVKQYRYAARSGSAFFC